MASILIEGGAVITVDDAQHVYDPGYVLLQDDQIAAVGGGEAPPDVRTRAPPSASTPR